MNHVYLEFLNKYNLTSGDYVVAAISGGPDSMALLSILNDVSKEKNFKIVCAHINHGLRKESEDEKVMVEKYCNENNIIFEYMKIDNYNKDNFHNDARKKRYSFFETLIKKYNSKYLFTAHHGDDLAETIFMRISRGSTIQGYAGFAEFSYNNGYVIARPLIKLSKDYILSYVKENNIPYAIDNSNSKDVYTRNRIRKNIIPEFKKENSKILSKINQFSETLFQCYEYIDKVVETKMQVLYKDNILNVDLFMKEEKIIQISVLQKMLNKQYGEQISLINNKHIEDLYNLIYSKRKSSSISLPKNIVAKKQYNKLQLILKEQEYGNFEYVFNKKIMLPNGKTIEQIENFNKNSNYICLLNSSEINLPLYVRNKEDGDIIYIKGLNGKKKISDIFINEKISNNERKTWPIVVDSDNQIVWLPGLKKSKFDKQKDENYDIILWYH